MTTEGFRKGAVNGGLKTAEQTAKEREARWDEIDFFLSCGFSPRYISSRLRVSAPALARQAYRQAQSATDEEMVELWHERARRFNYSRKEAA